MISDSRRGVRTRECRVSDRGDAQRISPKSRKQRGAALLAVLWLSAALSAIAFTVATRVRAETERTTTDVDALRAAYLADGAIDRALLYIQWGPNYKNADGTPKYFENPMPLMRFNFPTGAAHVEIIPETAKLNVNLARGEEIRNLMVLLGVEPPRAQSLTDAILDWRSPTPGGAFSQFDQHYLSMAPTFHARHASFHEIEELLLVQGVTPDLFYGSYTRDEDGKLLRHAALRDCLSVFGTKGVLDINTAEPAVMEAVGITPDAVTAIVNRRRQRAIKQADLPPLLGAAGPGAARLGIVPSVIVTLRATAAVRTGNGQLSDMRRTVSAMVKFLGPGFDEPYHVMRWYDNVVAPQ
jgi:general secretion pathway protein K